MNRLSLGIDAGDGGALCCAAYYRGAQSLACSIQPSDSYVPEPRGVIVILQGNLALLLRLVHQQVVNRRPFTPPLRGAACDFRRLQASLHYFLPVQPVLEVIALDQNSRLVE